MTDATNLGYVCGQHLAPRSACPVCELEEAKRTVEALRHTVETDAQLLAEQAQRVAELEQRDRVISHQLERHADGMDDHSKMLRGEIEVRDNRIAELEAERYHWKRARQTAMQDAESFRAERDALADEVERLESLFFNPHSNPSLIMEFYIKQVTRVGIERPSAVAAILASRKVPSLNNIDADIREHPGSMKIPHEQMDAALECARERADDAHRGVEQ